MQPDGRVRKKSEKADSETNVKTKEMEEAKQPFGDETDVDVPPGVETHFMQVSDRY